MPEEGSVNPSNEEGPMGEESPRLSTASVSSNERAPSATPPRPRPVSLVSTLSSGSASSRDDSLAPPTSHVDLELRPPEGHAHTDTGETDPGPGGGGGGRGHCRGWVHQQRTNREPVATVTGGSMSPSPQLTYLDRVVMEIIETERMYVRDLRMIVEDYLSHIIDQAELTIRPEQVCSLFGNIEDIYEFNSELLQSLDLCDNDPVAVARCFVMKTEDFDIYTQYCTNYPNSVAALTECMRNKSLAKFFRERQATLKRSLPLGSYLLKPVQRILKYHLLLQEIAKHFDPEEEEGYEVVQEAIYTMTGVAWYINDMKRKHEHSVRLQEVQSLLLNWKGADLTTYGELVLEGTFKVTRAKNERTLFLFERMLLIAKRRGDLYVYKSHITCSTLMLIESSKDSLCFSVTHYKHPKQPTTVQARTVEEKKLWTHHIKRLILENHHAIIPQKAKEAILEMDSVYRTRYRYSPDRLKKTLSCPSDEGPRERPRSEPNEQTVKNNKAVLKAEELTNDRTDDIQDHSQPAAEPAGGIEPAPMPSDPGCTLIVPPLTLLSTSPRRTAAPADKAVSSPGTPESDSKTLSSAESSDDEDKETSILPSSVLDQAGTIALHFSTSTRRGSVPSASGDDGATAARSLGCPSPRLPGSSRTASTLSLAAEPAADRSQQRLHSACSDDQENEGGATDDLTLLSPREDSLFDGGGDLLRGGALRRRRDSTLSKQDQMLIGKIKCYYETAESQDPVFSLRRRESLSYIPAGLVRNSVTRINSIPVKDPTSDSDAEAAGAAAAVEEVTMEENRPDDSPPIPAPVPEASSASAALRPERRPPQQEEVREERSGAVEDEEFRPSSEMIKIWRAMERDICGTTQGEPGGGGGGGGREKRSRELARNSRVSALSLSNRNHQTPRKNSEGERDGAAAASGESDLTTITEESAGPSALRSSRPPGRSSAGLAAVGRSCDQEGGLLRARPTRVQQLRANAVGERSRAPEPQQPLDHDDQAKSKVLHLARQYSQKIKSSKQPVVVQHRSLQHKMLPCVLEESDALSGEATMPGSPLTSSRETLSSSSSPLSLAAERLRAPPAPPPDPCTSDTMAGLRLLLLSSSSPGQNPNPHPPVAAAATRSPVSPTPPTEGFPWPHVRELRSKYVPRPDQTTPPVGRSQSVPERMLDGGAKRRSSCSSNLFQASSDSASSYQSHPSRGQQRRSVRLHRTSSLDPRLSRTRPSSVLEKQHTHTVRLPNGGHHDAEGYYVSGSAPLPGGSRKLLVMEKVPDSSPLGGAEPSGVEMLAREVREAGAEQEVDDDKDSYVQIRSPTSREKMSIMAVIERCRAYQESDEYKQREQDKEEEAGLKAEPVAVGGRGKEEGTAPNSTEQKTDDGTHSMVKNLREKFQNLK